MLLSLTTTHPPATDLGYLLHKSPFRSHQFDVTFGKAHVFYSEAAPDRCTANLMLEVDPVWLVRGRRGPAGEGHALEQYVNDRPYVASSFLSVAIAEVFGTALSGRSKERPELAAEALPFEARLSVVPCRGGEVFLRRLFEPLGYAVKALPHPLDEANPDWGPSRYFAVTLAGTKRLSELLTHLYVLIPVLDDDKHYWVGDAEVEKLVRHGEGWLAAHPERKVIAHRYLKHRRGLAQAALEQILAEEVPDADEAQAKHARSSCESSTPRSAPRRGRLWAMPSMSSSVPPRGPRVSNRFWRAPASAPSSRTAIDRCESSRSRSLVAQASSPVKATTKATRAGTPVPRLMMRGADTFATINTSTPIAGTAGR